MSRDHLLAHPHEHRRTRDPSARARRVVLILLVVNAILLGHLLSRTWKMESCESEVYYQGACVPPEQVSVDDGSVDV